MAKLYHRLSILTVPIKDGSIDKKSRLVQNAKTSKIETPMVHKTQISNFFCDEDIGKVVKLLSIDSLICNLSFCSNVVGMC